MAMSEVETLDALLRALNPHARIGAIPPSGAAIEELVSIAATAMFRAGYVQAAGVHTLCKSKQWEAAGANIRGLVESVIELHELFKVGSSNENSIKMLVFALLQLREYHQQQNGSAVEIARLDKRLADLETAGPGPYAEVVQQIAKGKPRYWPGRSRSAMLADTDKWASQVLPAEAPDLLKQGYKLLSWEAHHVMVLLQYIGNVPAGSSAMVVTMQGPEDPEFYAGFAARMLALAWELYSLPFGLKV
jgi:hypothetical protein